MNWDIFQVNRIESTEKLASTIDLQIHSFFSDGKETPVELLNQASEKGLKTLSITDHNSIKGYDDTLFSLSRDKGITLVPGVEIETEKDVDILVYDKNFDDDYETFRTDINQIVQPENNKRKEAAETTINALKSYLSTNSGNPSWMKWGEKSDTEKEEVLQRLTFDNASRVSVKTGVVEDYSRREYVGKPHIAALLAKYNLVDWAKFASEYKVSDPKRLLKKSYEVLFNEIVSWPQFQENETVVNQIVSLNHLKILAHPGKTYTDLIGDYSKEKFKSFIHKYIAKYNLDGAECFYGNYEENSIDFNEITLEILKDLSEKSGKILYGTGGTDSHGKLK